jgi:hypothetical protein
MSALLALEQQHAINVPAQTALSASRQLRHGYVLARQTETPGADVS